VACFLSQSVSDTGSWSTLVKDFVYDIYPKDLSLVCRNVEARHSNRVVETNRGYNCVLFATYWEAVLCLYGERAITVGFKIRWRLFRAFGRL
jgi:hypothetical protein